MAYRNKTTTPQRLLPTVLPFVVGSAPVYLITWWFGAFASGQTKKGCDFTDCRKVVDNHFLKYEILLLLSFALLVVMVWILRKKLNGKGIVAAFIVLGVVWPVLLTNTSLNMLETKVDKQRTITNQEGRQAELAELHNLSLQPYLPSYLPAGYKIAAIDTPSSKRLRLFFSKDLTNEDISSSNLIATDNMLELSVGERYRPPNYCPPVAVDKNAIQKEADGFPDQIIRTITLSGKCRQLAATPVFTLQDRGVIVYYLQQKGTLIKLVSLNDELSNDELLKVLHSMRSVPMSKFLEEASRVRLYPPADLGSISLTKKEEADLEDYFRSVRQKQQ